MTQLKKLAKLPIGIQTFATIREDEYLYVDKTDQALNLINNGTYYFLSRPRRFGKSLLVSTLQAIFEGREELFRGLAIHDKWDWNIKYPVIKISFGGVARNREEMLQDVVGILEENRRRLNITCRKPDDIGSCFKQLIVDVYEKYGQKVVILVDEYDKLIVDNLDQIEVAKEGREILKDLYTTIKDSDEYIKFTFLTGVSKFAKVSIFSGLNNLKDISLDKRYATICGYTHHDLETTFAANLKGADMEKVRQWYNGYNFLGEPVYNPFDILLFIDNDQMYDNYWFATGTPTFLIKLIKQHNYFIPKLGEICVNKALIDSFDIENIELEPILFQAGYLSIKQVTELEFGGFEYCLSYPNKEVTMSFNDVIVQYLTTIANTLPTKSAIYASLKHADLEAFGDTVTALFAAIPYNNHVKNPIGNYEGYYASVIYAYLASLGLNLIPEDVTNRGRIDLTVKMDNVIYILEFKVGTGDDESKALQQIKDKNYQQKYLDDGRTIYLIGIDFDTESRAVASVEWETV